MLNSSSRVAPVRLASSALELAKREKRDRKLVVSKNLISFSISRDVSDKRHVIFHAEFLRVVIRPKQDAECCL